MDQNNFYNQNTSNNQVDAMNIPEISNVVNAAFGKGLAATIMAWFPVASIIAIFFGANALKLVNEGNAIAARYGYDTVGKNIAAKVLGNIGKIAGIACTVFYGIYFVAFFFFFLIAILGM